MFVSLSSLYTCHFYDGGQTEYFLVLQLEVAEGQTPAMGPDGEVSMLSWQNSENIFDASVYSSKEEVFKVNIHVTVSVYYHFLIG